MLTDEFSLRGRPMLLNLVLRGQGLEPGRYLVFGFALNLPPDLMERSNGQHHLRQGALLP